MATETGTRRSAATLIGLGLFAKLPGLTLVPASSILSIPLLPVTLPKLAAISGRFRLLCIVAFACVPFGLLMRWISSTRGLAGGDTTDLVAISVWVTAFATIPAAGVYLAQIAGVRRIVIASLIGALAVSFVTSPALQWKGDFGIYVTLLLLALVGGRPIALSRVILVVSTALSAGADARGQALFSIVALAATVVPLRAANRFLSFPKQSLVAIGGITLAAVFGIYQAMLAGRLGESAQLRTQDQAVGGNPILGARVEWAAAAGVFDGSPLGYGTGVITPAHVQSSAISRVHESGGDYTASYFTEDVLGARHDFHSAFLNLWFHFGMMGVLLTFVMVLILVSSVLLTLASMPTFGALAAFAITVALWDQLFSPMADIDRMVTALFLCACLHAGIPWRKEQRPTRALGRSGALRRAV